MSKANFDFELLDLFPDEKESVSSMLHRTKIEELAGNFSMASQMYDHVATLTNNPTRAADLKAKAKELRELVS